MDAPTEQLYQAAIDAIERGWNIIPISLSSKKPLIEWKEYQTRHVSIEEVDDWFQNGVLTKTGARISDFNLGVVTGSISGLIVLDCDNSAAEEYARRNGLTSPISVKTRRGRHFYFSHPGDGMKFQNKVGGASHNWPEIPGLDLRADGGFAVLPPSIKVTEDGQTFTYQWDSTGFDIDEVADFVWRGPPESIEQDPTAFSFGALDLTTLRVGTADDGLSVREQIALRVAHLGRKLVDGDGRNNWLIRFAGQQVRKGVVGKALDQACEQFATEFFDEQLDESVFTHVLRSAEAMDRRRYPEDYDANGNRIAEAPAPKERFRPVFMGDVDRILDTLGDEEYLIEPFVARGQITQIVGFNGHGKSFVTAMVMAAAAAGHKEVGPFKIARRARVLYLDYDNPARTTLVRMRQFAGMFGDTNGDFGLWSPAIIKPDDGGEMILMNEDGFALLGEWVKHFKPDVTVIDTVRNAFPGIEEQKADAWVRVNHVAKVVRNTGSAVVLVHHRNKPGEGGLGREAGSTAQLTDIDTQMYVTQVFEDENVAKAKAGLTNDKLAILNLKGLPFTPFDYLRQMAGPDTRLRMVNQLSWGKVRNQSDLHETHYIGMAERLDDGTPFIVSTASARQKAVYLHRKGHTPSDIAQAIMIPTLEVRRWLGLP